MIFSIYLFLIQGPKEWRQREAAPQFHSHQEAAEMEIEGEEDGLA